MKTGRNTKARQQAILRHLHQNGRAMVEDLAAFFETTPQTIRKDLNILAEEGRVMRFHGGAALLAGSEYTGYEVRQQIARDQKERIARAAAKLVPNNTAIIINTGTTTAEVARCLGQHSGLKIVADSVLVANETRHFPGVEVMVPGGVVRGSDGAILGESAVEFIRQFRADLAIVGCAAIASDGALLDYDLREAAVARAILGCSRNVILTADSSKFERMAPVCIGNLQQMRTLVTDKACPAELRNLCRSLGVGLVLAE
ncbi:MULTISPECIES: DeoR/GlpR family DNA-binding transcription regulator [Aliiruegeria]|uniref:Transcriptional regulator, DeoR family n=1 Tax=Aliiruegeria lutimaris TaxID=571298 RepID=A0A1G8Y718_9RHOB|nr:MULTISPECIES: DeoR/GlpR family DNA-binding transcription regulator [Aliiruegeria]NDR57007.1 DeoR/GlpR transcriptional regulator [Pseudoruegeria sp. M32A2M]SDJ98204.1 transcriptional regulator, DeoR family [Aliiruegeria lutimaris]